MKDASHDNKVYARMKYNACLLRLRSLQRNIDKRKEAEQSNNSNGESEDSPRYSNPLCI